MTDFQSNSPSSPIVELNNLTFAYQKGENVLEDVNLKIYQREITALAGISGSGKTTLGYILKGLIPHSIKGHLRGEISVAGYNVKKTKIARLAQDVGMVFQNLNSQLFNTTVQEEIEFGLRNLDLNLDWANEAMDFLGITNLQDRMPMNLSAGQKQRVVLASIIATHPKFLILDEPAAHLDYPSKEGLKSWLAKLNNEFGMTILIIEQDPWIIGELCESILFLDQKQIRRYEKDQLLEKRPSWSWDFEKVTSL